MTLIAAVLLGLVCGFVLGFNRKALGVFITIWLVVLAVQSIFVLDEDTTDDAAYWLVQLVIFAVGIGLLWLASWLRAWRRHAS